MEFAFLQNKLTTLGDMKRVWLSRKFSFIFEASPTTNLAFFVQSLYAHSIGMSSHQVVAYLHILKPFDLFKFIDGGSS